MKKKYNNKVKELKVTLILLIIMCTKTNNGSSKPNGKYE